MNTSVAINMFAKAVLRERRLPFDVVSYNLDPFYSQANQDRLIKAKESAWSEAAEPSMSRSRTRHD